MQKYMNKLMVAGLAGSLLIGAAGPTLALPLASNGTAVEKAAPVTTTDVRWRGRHGHWHNGRWIGPAVGLGILGLGIAAATAPRYYDGPYGYYDPYYGGRCMQDRWGRVFCN